MAKVKRLLLLLFALVLVAATFTSCDSIGSDGSEEAMAKVIAIRTSYYAMEASERLYVELKPTSVTETYVTYIVKLYEKGTFRASVDLEWSQAEINVQSTKYVFFSLTNEEYEAYRVLIRTENQPDGSILMVTRDLRDIFSVEVSSTYPTVLTKAATNVTTDSATLNGALTDLGTADGVVVDFLFGTESGLGEDDLNHSVGKQRLTSTGSFSYDIEGLDEGTTYYFKAVGSSPRGTSYGTEKSFTTPDR
jgi:hypothetical protein